MSRIVWDAKHQGLKSEHLTKFQWHDRSRGRFSDGFSNFGMELQIGRQEFDIFARIVYVKIRTDDLRHRAESGILSPISQDGSIAEKYLQEIILMRQFLRSGWNDISNERIEPWGRYRLGGPKSVCPTQLHQEEGKPLCPKYPAVRIRKRPVLSKTSGGRDWEEGELQASSKSIHT
ncbi:predicted protein [Histoplasma capsulatum G186AR]|uniref:Uncharacterized protein n=1 Tax=Ajellomyces capsulatus (strain G186AR / H82 / ATCC MYA-2454 / RMSCC 2432) TaxID=447093 RepID=C0NYF1_AJECG|nr:uncharacterized protein HCBG_07945 [Histoplasma capsulatum G186AR]EEH03819.1 predicted protein [Histoplasma capsulatum G186AR]